MPSPGPAWTLRNRHCQGAPHHHGSPEAHQRAPWPSKAQACAGFSGHTNATRLADLNNLGILGAAVRQSSKMS
ncbi:MAG: hypothetical protein CM15mP103_06210 [Gammaproteobacteria bacterium]|nr:MAG: hypothetical protein CM15mP103_06210 [Gammaproteobacteria bacterium]